MLSQIKDYVRFAWQVIDGSRADHEKYLAKIRQKDISPYINGRSVLRVLDLANGNLRPQYMLLKARGYQVFGIDRANRSIPNLTNLLYRLARWFYARSLGIAPASSLGTLICGDVAHLPFPENSFDLVTSIAAFEHFYDVPSVVAEMRRVARPRGLVWVWIHPFSCLSGGHNLTLTEVPLRTVPAGTDPWDHLRRRRLPFHVPLNEWRINQYVETFESHFQVIQAYCAMREGEEYLTEEVSRELSAYNDDELTCAGYVILARRRA